ncbi:MAG TPA: hypothetical protein VGZ29_12925 [Terriglobia bacterium]|nr:hypothetical protein [Terriglobia bacterium]
MRAKGIVMFAAVVLAFGGLGAEAGQSTAAAAQPSSGTVVPRLIQFSGLVRDASGKTATGTVAITFSLYELEDGGAPLWSETQTLALDAQGHYTAFLGGASPEGLPLDLFASGAARWLGVAPALTGVGEQTRVLLVGVPYALKAADADTLGGRPASAYVTTDNATEGEAALNPPGSASLKATGAGAPGGGAASAKGKIKTPALTITGGGTTNYVPLWTGSTALGNSVLFQTGSGSTAKIGIGTTAPLQILHVNGSSEILSTGSGAGFKFQDRAGGTSPYGVWYSMGSVARFWRSDLNGKGGDVLGITSTGNVGIGTTSPTNVLQVNGATPIYSTGSGGGLAFQDRSGGTSPYAQWYSTGDVARFWWSDYGDVLGITTAGRVGIGTSSPTVNLQVVGSSTPQIRVSNTATKGSSISYVGADANQTVALVGADGLGTGPMGTPSGFFGTSTNQPAGIVTDNLERLRVTTTGQVGIGTPSPVATLEVNGTARFDQSVTFATGQIFPNTATLGANVFEGNQSVTGNVSATASISGAAAAFSGSASTAIANVTQSGSGAAVAAANNAASGQTVGAEGTVSASTGSGLLGVNVNSSVTGGQHPGYSGVWGDSGASGNDGVLGTADDGFAMVAYNNSPSGDATLFVENLNAGSGLPLIKAVAGNGTTCIVANSDGSTFCQGTQSAVVPVDGRKLALYTIQAPDNWFEDVGSATLSDGAASVKLEPKFAQTVNTRVEYHVFLTPKGDCDGLFVTDETPAGFEVRELRHGRSNVAFDYRIVARRRGYENVRLGDETTAMDAPAPRSPGHTAGTIRLSQTVAGAGH